MVCYKQGIFSQQLGMYLENITIECNFQGHLPTLKKKLHAISNLIKEKIQRTNPKDRNINIHRSKCKRIIS